MHQVCWAGVGAEWSQNLNLLCPKAGALESQGWNALSRERRGELLRELDVAIDMRSWPGGRP